MTTTVLPLLLTQAWFRKGTKYAGLPPCHSNFGSKLTCLGDFDLHSTWSV